MTETTKRLSIAMTVDEGTDAQMAKAMEKLSNVATGLALDGLSVQLVIEQDDYGWESSDEEGEEEDAEAG